MDKNRVYGASALEMDYNINYELYLKGYYSNSEWIKYSTQLVGKLFKENEILIDKLKNTLYNINTKWGKRDDRNFKAF